MNLWSFLKLTLENKTEFILPRVNRLLASWLSEMEKFEGNENNIPENVLIERLKERSETREILHRISFVNISGRWFNHEPRKLPKAVNEKFRGEGRHEEVKYVGKLFNPSSTSSLSNVFQRARRPSRIGGCWKSTRSVARCPLKGNRDERRRNEKQLRNTLLEELDRS